MIRDLVSVALLSALAISAHADSLDAMAEEFWRWRAVNQPFSGDDIPRIERPSAFAPDWSPSAVAQRRSTLADFEQRWRAIDPSSWPAPRRVNHSLIGSALARVRWELEIERGWRRNPLFYVSQTAGSVFESMLQPPPFSAERSREIVLRLARIPQTVAAAETNLTEMARPFASLAIAELDGIGPRLTAAMRELQPRLSTETEPATERAITALERFRAWLQQRAPALPEKTAVGRENYVYFLRNVALMPFSPEQLLQMGRQEWERAASFEAYEHNRNQGAPELALFPDQAAQIARERDDEIAVRRFLESHHLLTVPAWMPHYRNLPLPKWLEPLKLGVTDDLTGASRLKDDAVSYIRPPSPRLGYFALASARDPRPILVHEGVPGHYFQLALSWANSDPIRRHYYDSGANEGIGFYAEEMMLQAGYFDDSPRTREIIYNFMRLRALRVEVDVKLALGEFGIDEAGAYLARTVPMDLATARDEAAMFASMPGQAISYQIGKLQILGLLADARRAQVDRFSLRGFHDFVWRNGNVPISLQRLEYLQ